MKDKYRIKTAKYIGNFPPPYGGVTKKNELLYKTLNLYMPIERSKKIFANTKMNNLNAMIDSLFSRERLIIGVSAAKGSSRILTFILYIFNRKIMKKSIYFMMGGREADRIVKNKKEVLWYGNYKRIFVETQSMKDKMCRAGMQNVDLYPNCRKRPTELREIKSNYGKLKCVFFSGINKVKGADIVLQAAKEIESVEFFFYGHIAEDYKLEFFQNASQLKNVSYKGIFDGNSSELYQLLSFYDVMLFPTKWENEGVPGVLVEAKIAGITSIVSDMCYNSEIVKDKVDGIVLGENTSIYLEKAIIELDNNRNFLVKLKENSQKSAEHFYIDNYLESIIKPLRQ